jgi:hypothetical protein
MRRNKSLRVAIRSRKQRRRRKRRRRSWRRSNRSF